MCGITGKMFLNQARSVDRFEIESMLGPISHRGPDGNGIYLDGPVGLGHCRLSIIDVAGGAQPMANEDETVWIVFNGEIYNYQSIRDDLLTRGHIFRSRTDTEVIVHLYEEYGVDCLHQLRGMFAFAIWDKRKQRLFIARDRVGIKPLYYSLSSSALYFGSELKSIIADPAINRELSPAAFRQFFSFGYIPGADTPFKCVQKLPPGHYLLVQSDGLLVQRYWDLKFTRTRADRSFDEVVEELHALLRNTVRDHMIADVPVGTLLSGGVDSSAVLSLAVQGTEKKIKTFTVGFDGEHVVDERPFARLAAERFGTDHYDLTISSDDFWNFLPGYVAHMEEPVCEPPAVALHYVSQLAKKYVKVLLSGEGGDEAFAGYPNYPNMLFVDRVARSLGPMSGAASYLSVKAGQLLGLDRFDRYGRALGKPLDGHYFSRSSDPTCFFNRHATQVFTDEFFRAGSPDQAAVFMGTVLNRVRDRPLLDQMLYVDTNTWLPNDLLIKADKITMASSLELRVPLLDHEVLEFAASLPDHYKVSGRETKRALKAAFAKVLPPEILTRKKVGFPVPYGGWMRGPLAPRIKEVLLSERSLARGYYRPGQLETILREFGRTGEAPKVIFSLLVTELWHRHFVDADSG